MKVKRWLLLIILGLLLMGTGFSVLGERAVLGHLEQSIQSLIYQVSDTSLIQVLAFSIVLIGFICVIAGFRRMIISILNAVHPTTDPLVEIIYAKRQLERGP